MNQSQQKSLQQIKSSLNQLMSEVQQLSNELEPENKQLQSKKIFKSDSKEISNKQLSQGLKGVQNSLESAFIHILQLNQQTQSYFDMSFSKLQQDSTGEVPPQNVFFNTSDFKSEEKDDQQPESYVLQSLCKDALESEYNKSMLVSPMKFPSDLKLFNQEIQYDHLNSNLKRMDEILQQINEQ